METVVLRRKEAFKIPQPRWSIYVINSFIDKTKCSIVSYQMQSWTYAVYLLYSADSFASLFSIG